jgi:hypothetical protein
MLLPDCSMSDGSDPVSSLALKTLRKCVNRFVRGSDNFGPPLKQPGHSFESRVELLEKLSLPIQTCPQLRDLIALR